LRGNLSSQCAGEWEEEQEQEQEQEGAAREDVFAAAIPFEEACLGDLFISRDRKDGVFILAVLISRGRRLGLCLGTGS